VAARVLLLIALLTARATLAWAIPRQASATAQQETAVSASSDSSKQAGEQTPAAPKADDKDQKDAKAPRKTHVRLGTISFGLGYSSFSGPYYYPYPLFGVYPYGLAYPAFFCDPFWCAPASLLNPFYSGSLAYAEDKGEIKLTADPKTAEVYIDGAYAGTADHLKTMWLDSGAYDLSLSANGRKGFHQRIYILGRRSLKILARLEPEKAPDPAGETEVKP
jgi:hypothetical protein